MTADRISGHHLTSVMRRCWSFADVAFVPKPNQDGPGQKHTPFLKHPPELDTVLGRRSEPCIAAFLSNHTLS